MKVLLVTSQVTFVPDNYNGLVLEMANHKNIAGLVELKNRDLKLFFKALGLCFFIAPRIGWQLLSNMLGNSSARRRKTLRSKNKTFIRFDSVNSGELRDYVKSNNIDLIVNARTRFIYGKELLGAPKSGCINIHHGLLPQQRGTMCDLWALAQNQDAGFSIHHMTARIDDGPILVKQVVPAHDKNYMNYLRRAAQQEAKALAELMDRMESGDVTTTLNSAPQSETVYRKNPTIKELRQLKSDGLII